MHISVVRKKCVVRQQVAGPRTVARTTEPLWPAGDESWWFSWLHVPHEAISTHVSSSPWHNRGAHGKIALGVLGRSHMVVYATHYKRIIHHHVASESSMLDPTCNLIRSNKIPILIKSP